MRERLIELIQKSVNGCARHWAEVIADYLLENGVIVPPNIYGVKWSAEVMFDEWNNTTGAVPQNTSWYYELQSVIEDIVCLAFGAGMLYREEAEQALQKKERDTE